MSGADIAAEASAAIREAGAEVGTGVPLTGQIIRRGLADESTSPPTPGGEVSHSLDLILWEYSAHDRDGTNITERDVRAMIAADAETDPRNGDSLIVQGRTYSVMNVKPYQPGGVVLYWICQIRSANG